MAFYRKQSGTNVAATPRYRSGASWVTPGQLRRRAGTTWITAWSALAVTVNNLYRERFEYEPAPLTIPVSGTPNPVVTGSSSYSASWSRVSGSTAITCSNASILNPQFSATVFKNSEEYATWRLTVTDIPSGLQVTKDITVGFAYYTNL